MLSALWQGLIFLIQLIFDVVIIIFILRFLLQLMGGSYYNPISQFVIKLTSPIIMPLRRVIPIYKNYDISILLIAFLLSLIEEFLVLFLSYYPATPGVAGLVILALSALFEKFIYFYFYLILIRVLMSWFVMLKQGPMTEVVYLLSEPLLRLVRGRFTLFAGFDFSPLVLLIATQLLSIFITNPLTQIGMRLAFT